MANTPQARKRVRQAVKARTRNAAQKSNFRSSIKKVLKSLAEKNKEQSNINFKEAMSIMDKLVVKGLIHKNKAARYFKDWYQENYGAGIPIPPVKEVVQYFERKMGKIKKGGHQPHHWVGFRWVQKNNNQDLSWMEEED